MIYITELGDTWDLIAYRIYGRESHATYIMQSNFRHLDTLLFHSGVSIVIPDLPDETESNLPPWRTASANTVDAYRNIGEIHK